MYTQQTTTPSRPDIGGSPRDLFRRLDPRSYPEVADYSWEEICGHGDNMAPGALYLAARMTRAGNLDAGDLVLDLACGKGDSSLFLAERFGVTVICFDLWTPVSFLNEKIAQRGLRSRVIPLDLDATARLPFPEDYFDTMFCMQAFHSFGSEPSVLHRLLTHLKPGGRLLVGGSCFDQEHDDGELPEIYAKTDGWDAEYATYHSPEWWGHRLGETGMVDVIMCSELEDGLVMLEDEVLHHGQRAGWSQEWHLKARWLVDHLLYSRDHVPSLTHYVGAFERKSPEPHNP